ncbi:hypothetical protein [Paracoccus sp. (in: a-proteobacteria)]|uniref:hypothetical protein n=1 Tax=Paracoccus sp. TaxID=267 RepID=UPI002899F0A8|nr:hypothetical protein [Paracoccus sp. (in: a-proteobacteria)]
MALRPEHELHSRRRSRNMGLLVVLLLFVALVFGLSIVKITNGDLMEGFDHQMRTSVLPITEPIAGQTPPANQSSPTVPQTETQP